MVQQLDLYGNKRMILCVESTLPKGRLLLVLLMKFFYQILKKIKKWREEGAKNPH